MSNAWVLGTFMIVLLSLWVIITAAYMIYCRVKYGDFGGKK